jgi:hypothetical protein
MGTKNVLNGLSSSRARKIAGPSCHFKCFGAEMLINLNAKAGQKPFSKYIRV